MSEADPNGVISRWLAENGFQATHQWYGSVQLALVGFGAANAPHRTVDARAGQRHRARGLPTCLAHR